MNWFSSFHRTKKKTRNWTKREIATITRKKKRSCFGTFSCCCCCCLICHFWLTRCVAANVTATSNHWTNHTRLGLKMRAWLFEIINQNDGNISRIVDIWWIMVDGVMIRVWLILLWNRIGLVTNCLRFRILSALGKNVSPFLEVDLSISVDWCLAECISGLLSC